MAKLFLIDAYALIYRSYYAFIKNPRINSKGLNTSAVMGFCNTLNEVLTKEKPTHIGVAFDHGKTFRHDAFPEYKAQREETPEDIKLSVPLIKQVLEAMRIPILQVDGFEADDIIGTVATRFGADGIDTFMLTPDKDYGQLIGPNVFMYRPRHGGGYEILGEKEVGEKYGIPTPAQVVDLLALMGDSADNFPGCPGVGEKTAAKLINQFGSIDNMLQHTDEIKGKLREKVENAVEDIKMSKFLATIRTDVPMQLDLDELKVEQPDETKLRAIFEELEFKTLINKFLNKGEAKPKTDNNQLDLFAENTTNESDEPKNAKFESIKTTQHEYKLVENEEELRQLCDFFITKESVSIDTETTSTDAISAELVGLSFSVEEKKAFYVPIPADYEEATKYVQIFKPLYESDKIMKIGQNIKYDYEVLSRYGVTLQGKMFDTMIAHYLIQPELHHNMDYMAETLLGYQTIHIEELLGPKGKKQKNMRDLSPTDIYEYAAEDADITLRLKNVLEPRLKELGVEELFWNIEMPLVRVLADMELNGVCLDTEALQDTSKIFTERMKQYEQEIYKEAGEEFNISSPKQVGDILFGKMQIMDKPKKTKTGQYATSEEVLAPFAAKHKIVADILEWRQVQKLKSTYVDALPLEVNPRTGRVHTTYMQTVAATGRLSSNNPNLQNIPIRTERGQRVRKAFIARNDDYVLLSADYSQIELRIIAALSEEHNMIESFLHGEDIHRATAAKVFNVPLEAVTREQRSHAKTVNFGIIYGVSAFGLSAQTDLSRSQSKELIDTYYATYPNLRNYIQKQIHFAQEHGYVETVLGRRRYLPDIHSRNQVVRGAAERNAVNAPIQGSAADIIKIAMIRIYDLLQAQQLQTRMLLQVHDELVFDVPKNELEIVKPLIKEAMESAFTLAVPLVADLGIGNNWLDAH